MASIDLLIPSMSALRLIFSSKISYQAGIIIELLIVTLIFGAFWKYKPGRISELISSVERWAQNRGHSLLIRVAK